ncbi:hypothetical protein JB92DRAFT_2851672 [Gautieria morchelliformis]|nr:hypothetical protein JB92DRAFT_2851672 [Gautieria morchelliformis]
MASQIPSELIDTIIDYLRHEVSALCACSLVSRRWLPRPRYHLFAFMHLMSTNIVSALKILGPPSTFLPSIYALMLTEGRGDPWNRKWVDTSLPEVPLSRMVGVQSLTLANVRWCALGEAAKTSISALAQGVKSLCLINFRMHSFAELLELLSESPALVTLKMNMIAFEKPEDASPVERYTIPRSLRTLEFGGSTGLLIDWLLVQHSIPNIHTVVLTMVDAKEVPGVSSLLCRLGPYLEHLDISFYSFDPGETEAIFCQRADLTPNSSLRSIKFSNLSLYGYDAIPNAVWIRSILAQIISQQLQQVTFAIFLNAPEELALLELPQLASLFSENQRFSRLRSVLFMIRGHLEGGLRQEVHVRIKGSLSDLNARGRLQIM